MEITIKTDNKRIYNFLLGILKQLGIESLSNKNKISRSSDYPLQGSVTLFERPFDSATEDWDALK